MTVDLRKDQKNILKYLKQRVVAQ
ncbi:MAG: hypothetical protein JWM11_5845, partial [Planctomycetaceae bacterium]|nr:hypothetical protein [Planctomycetaceae bacterium]